MRILNWIVVTPVILCAGCVTSPWNEKLMSNVELLQANCAELQLEKRRVGENSIHLADTAKSGGFGTVLIGMLEGVAAYKTGSTLDPSKSAAFNMISIDDENSKQADELASREKMIATLSQKRNCK